MEDGYVDFKVYDLDEQEVLVCLQADDVLRFEGNILANDARSSIPDPITTFVHVARLGMLTRSTVAPWLSGAELLSREIDLPSRKETCRVRLWNVDNASFRVLANMLLARVPEYAVIETVSTRSPTQGHSRIDFAQLRYPAPFGATSFPVDYRSPTRSSRERFVQLLLARTPTPAELEVIYSGMDRWAQLPLLGGYPTAEMAPWHSAAVADPAFLLDPCTVEQCFPELFLCDDECYAAVVNWASVVHRQICPVERVLLR
jgi:hypothetical protein